MRLLRDSLGLVVSCDSGLRGRDGSLVGESAGLNSCVEGRSWRLPDAAASSQVYEQLYDTLDITGSAEIRAHATAKVGTPYPITQGIHGTSNVSHSWFLCDFCQIFVPPLLLLIYNLF